MSFGRYLSQRNARRSQDRSPFFDEDDEPVTVPRNVRAVGPRVPIRRSDRVAAMEESNRFAPYQSQSLRSAPQSIRLGPVARFSGGQSARSVPSARSLTIANQTPAAYSPPTNLSKFSTYSDSSESEPSSKGKRKERDLTGGSVSSPLLTNEEYEALYRGFGTTDEKLRILRRLYDDYRRKAKTARPLSEDQYYLALADEGVPENLIELQNVLIKLIRAAPKFYDDATYAEQIADQFGADVASALGFTTSTSSQHSPSPRYTPRSLGSTSSSTQSFIPRFVSAAEEQEYLQKQAQSRSFFGPIDQQEEEEEKEEEDNEEEEPVNLTMLPSELSAILAPYGIDIADLSISTTLDALLDVQQGRPINFSYRGILDGIRTLAGDDVAEEIQIELVNYIV